MTDALGPVPTLHLDHHGLPVAFGDVPAGAYRIITLLEGPLTGKDILIRKRPDNAVDLFLVPENKIGKSLRLDGIGHEPDREPLEKTFIEHLGSHLAAQSAAKTVAPTPPPQASSTWTSTNKPTHIAHVSLPSGQTKYIGMHGTPMPDLESYKIGNPADRADGSIGIRNGQKLAMTPVERATNRAYGVTNPTADLPSARIGTNAQEAVRRRVSHPDFRMIDETGKSKSDRWDDMERKVLAGGLVPSDHPYLSPRAYMGIGPDGHVIHVATAATEKMRPELPQSRGESYAYGEHSHKSTGDYPDRGHADDFLHHAIYNPAWVTMQRRHGKDIMYRHVYPRADGKNSQLEHDAPGGLTYVMERIRHPNDPNGNHWNLQTVITNQGYSRHHPTHDQYVAESHRLADDNRGARYIRSSENPNDPGVQAAVAASAKRYEYLSNKNSPKIADPDTGGR